MRQIFILIILFTSCLISVHAQNLKDTLTVKPNSVIFFTITQSEFEQLSAEDSEGGINEVISDFDYYASTLIPILEKDSTKYAFYTAHRYYRIINKNSFIIFDRLKQPEHVVGIILNSEKSTEILWGVDTDVGMMQSINKYFDQ